MLTRNCPELSEIGNRTCESQHHRIAAFNLLCAIIDWNVTGASSPPSGARLSCEAN
jgi:3-deoxy-D-arabino-heptulosonate 7-phosphate (DAHP) synthase